MEQRNMVDKARSLISALSRNTTNMMEEGAKRSKPTRKGRDHDCSRELSNPFWRLESGWRIGVNGEALGLAEGVAKEKQADCSCRVPEGLRD